MESLESVKNAPKVENILSAYSGNDTKLPPLPNGIEKTPIITGVSDLVGYDNRPHYHAGDVFDENPFKDTETYDNYIKAKEQGWLEQFYNMTARGIMGEIVGGVIQGAGSVVEKGFWNSTYNEIHKALYNEPLKDLAERDLQFDNMLIRVGRRIGEDMEQSHPIFTENPNDTFAFGDFGWWANGGVSAFSAAGLFIPARAGLMGITKFGKLIAPNQILALSSKIGKTGTIMAKSAVEAGFMRHMENAREAHQVWEQVEEDYSTKIFKLIEANTEESNKELEELRTNLGVENYEDIPQYLANAAASENYRDNLSNYLFDVMQVYALRKLPSSRAASSELGAISTKAAALQAESLGKTFTMGDKILNKVAYGARAIGSQWTEGIEEIINGISEKEGVNYAKYLYENKKESKGERLSNFTERLQDYLVDPHILEQGFFGVFGGAIYTGTAQMASKAKALVTKAENPSLSKLQEQEIASRTIQGATVLGQLQSIENGINPMTGKAIVFAEDASLVRPNETAKEKENRVKKETESLEKQKQILREKVYAIAGNNLGLTASRSGSMNLLEEWLTSDAAKAQFEKMGLGTKEEVSNILNHVRTSALATEEIHNKINRRFLKKQYSGERYVTDYIIANAVGAETDIDYLNNERSQLEQELSTLREDAALNEDEGVIFDLQTRLVALESLLAHIEEVNVAKVLNSETLGAVVTAKLSETLAKFKEEKAQIEAELAANGNKTNFKNHSLFMDTATALAKVYLNEFQKTKSTSIVNESIENPNVASEIHANVKAAAEEAAKNTVNKYKTKLELVSEDGDFIAEINKIKEEMQKEAGTVDVTAIDFEAYKTKLAKKKAAKDNKNSNSGEDATSIKAKKVKALEGYIETFAEKEITEEEEAEFGKEHRQRIEDSINNADLGTPEGVSAFGEFVDAILTHTEESFEDAAQRYGYKIANNAIQKRFKDLLDKTQNATEKDIKNLAEDVTELIDAVENVFIAPTASPNSINIFLAPLASAQKTKDENGNILTNHLDARVNEIINNLREDDTVIVREAVASDFSSKQEFMDTQTKGHTPLVITTKNGSPIGFLNRLDYLTGEISFTSTLINHLNSKDVPYLLTPAMQKLLKDADIRFKQGDRAAAIETLKNDKEFRRILNASDKTFNADLAHLLQLLFFDAGKGNYSNTFEFNKERLTNSLENWKQRILRDYKNTEPIVAQFQEAESKGLRLTTKLTKISPGAVVSSNKLNNPLEVLSITPTIFTTAKGAYSLILENRTPSKLDKKTVRMEVAANETFYTMVQGAGGKLIPVPMQVTNLNNDLNKEYKEKAITHVMGLASEILILFNNGATRNNPEVLAKIQEISNILYYKENKDLTTFEFNKGKVVDGVAKNSSNFQIKNFATGEVLRFYQNSPRKDGSIPNPTVYNGAIKLEFEDGITKVREALASINRAVNMETLKSEAPYFDTVDKTTYPSYADYLFQSGALGVRVGAVKAADGSIIGNVSYKSNNGYGIPLQIEISKDTKVQTKEEIEADKNKEIADHINSAIDEIKTPPKAKTLNDRKEEFQATEHGFLLEEAAQYGVTVNEVTPTFEQLNANANYDTRTKVVTLSKELVEARLEVSNTANLLFAHELIHGIAYGVLKGDTVATRKFVTESQKLIKRLLKRTEIDVIRNNEKVNLLTEAELKQVKRILNKLDKLLNSEVKGEKSPTTAAHELITYSFSDRAFAKVLNMINDSESSSIEEKSDKTRTLWDRLVDLITNLIGSKLKDNSYLDSVRKIANLKLTEEKIETTEETVVTETETDTETPKEEIDKKADIEIGKVGNTEYEVKADGVYYQGKKLNNPENKTHRQLIEADIERRGQEELEYANFEGRQKEIQEGRENTKKIFDNLKQKYPVNTLTGQVLRLLEKLIDINRISTISEKNHQSARGGKANGSAFEGGIILDSEIFDRVLNGEARAVKTFIHELFHQILNTSQFEAHKRGENTDLSSSQIKAWENLERLYEKAKSISNAKSEYGFTNLSEFLAEAFSNQGFKKELSERKGEGKDTTLFKEILNSLLDFFKESLSKWAKRFNKPIPEINSGLLQDVMYWSEQLLDINKPYTPDLTTKEINAKYDAELKELEEPSIETETAPSNIDPNVDDIKLEDTTPTIAPVATVMAGNAATLMPEQEAAETEKDIEEAIVEEEAKGKTREEATEAVTEQLNEAVNNEIEEIPNSKFSQAIQRIAKRIKKVLIALGFVLFSSSLYTGITSFTTIVPYSQNNIETVDSSKTTKVYEEHYNEISPIIDFSTTDAIFNSVKDYHFKGSTKELIVVDKGSNTIRVYNKEGKVIFASVVITGANKNADVVQRVKALEDYTTEDKVTPSGVFTIAPTVDTHYGGEVLFGLPQTKSKTIVAIHSLYNTEERQKALKTEAADDNYLSFGCINVPTEAFKDLKTSLKTGENSYVNPSVYIIPTNPKTKPVFNEYLSYRQTHPNTTFEQYVSIQENSVKEIAKVKKDSGINTDINNLLLDDLTPLNEEEAKRKAITKIQSELTKFRTEDKYRAYSYALRNNKKAFNRIKQDLQHKYPNLAFEAVTINDRLTFQANINTNTLNILTEQYKKLCK